MNPGTSGRSLRSFFFDSRRPGGPQPVRAAEDFRPRGAPAAREALDSGQISCLTLDDFGREPPDDWYLVTHPNVIATPHIGAYTTESVERATIAAVDNLLLALRA